MEWRLGPKPLPPGEIFWPIFIYRNRLWVIRVLWWVVLPCFSMRENIVAASCTMYSFLIIVKSLQLRRRRQIVEPRKYCLVSVIIFLWCVFFYFLFLTSWEFGQIPYTSLLILDCTITSFTYKIIWKGGYLHIWQAWHHLSTFLSQITTSWSHPHFPSFSTSQIWRSNYVITIY